MRMDLTGRRPWWLSLWLRMVSARVGMAPGPMQWFTARPDLVDWGLFRYIRRGSSPKGRWSQGEAELFSTFVSDLNTCHF